MCHLARYQKDPDGLLGYLKGQSEHSCKVSRQFFSIMTYVDSINSRKKLQGYPSCQSLARTEFLRKKTGEVNALYKGREMGSDGLSYQDLIICLSKEYSQSDSRRATVGLYENWKNKIAAIVRKPETP